MTHQNWRNRSVKVMVFNATLSNSSAMSLRQFYWWRKPEYQEYSCRYLSQVTVNFIT
jgi:hypothetical protein